MRIRHVGGIVVVVGACTLLFVLRAGISYIQRSTVIEHPTTQYQPVLEDPGFGDATATLAVLTHIQHASGENDFCVVGQRLDGGGDIAWIYWVQRNALIYWEPGADIDQLLLPRNYLDISSDVSDSDAAHTSTYMLTPHNLLDILAACDKVGTFISIDREVSTD